MSKTDPVSPAGEPAGPDLILTIDEAAALLKVSSRTVRRLVDRGEINVFRLGRSVRIMRQSIERLLR